MPTASLAHHRLVFCPPKPATLNLNPRKPCPQNPLPPPNPPNPRSIKDFESKNYDARKQGGRYWELGKLKPAETEELQAKRRVAEELRRFAVNVGAANKVKHEEQQAKPKAAPPPREPTTQERAKKYATESVPKPKPAPPAPPPPPPVRRGGGGAVIKVPAPRPGDVDSLMRARDDAGRRYQELYKDLDRVLS